MCDIVCREVGEHMMLPFLRSKARTMESAFGKQQVADNKLENRLCRRYNHCAGSH